MRKIFLALFISFLLLLNTSYTSAASVGDALVNPEQGWDRYLYDEVNITYEGKWAECEVSRCTKNVWQTAGSKIKFNFVGEQFRFISYAYNNGSKDIDVYIDGEAAGKFTLYGANDSTDRLIYQSPLLEAKEHSVEIVNNTKEYLYIVAIDLPGEGSLEPYNPIIPVPGPIDPEPTDPDPTDPGPVDPTPTPDPDQDPSGERAILVVTMDTGLEKEFDLSMSEVNSFISWYEGRQSGSGTAAYAINKHNNNKGPFSSRKDYVIFNKILTFEVSEYN